LDKKAEEEEKRLGVHSSAEANDDVSLEHIRKFELPFWLVAITCVSIYSVFPFQWTVSVSYLKDSFDYGTTRANFITSLLGITSAILSPLLGLGIDKLGYRAHLMIFAALMFISAYTTLAALGEHGTSTTYGSVLATYIWVGVSLSFFGAVLWPSIPSVVEEEYTGTAFGLVTALQNGGLAVIPVLLTAIHGDSKVKTSYVPSFLTLIALNAVGAVSALILLIVDVRRYGGKLKNK
jgi:MFS family permease